MVKREFANRKYHHYICFPIYHNRQVIPHLEATERLMNENISYLIRGDKPRGRREKI